MEVIQRRWLSFQLRRLEIRRQLVGEDGGVLGEDESGGRSSGSGGGEVEVGAPVVGTMFTDYQQQQQHLEEEEEEPMSNSSGSRSPSASGALYRAGGGGSWVVQSLVFDARLRCGDCRLIRPQKMRWVKWATCVLPFILFPFLFYFQKFILLHKSIKLRCRLALPLKR
jgi:hypothetical protein